MSDMSEQTPREQWPPVTPALARSNGATPHLSDELLAAWTAHELGAEEHTTAQRHLDACASCQRAVAQTQHIRALTRATAAREATESQTTRAGASLAESILARLSTVETAPPPPSTTPREVVSILPPTAPSPRSQRREVWRRFAALAAVLLLIASSALLFTRLSGRRPLGNPAATATPARVANMPGNWAQVLPAGAAIRDVAVVSPSDIWVAGVVSDTAGLHTLLMRYDGKRWQVSPDHFDDALLNSITMVSASDGWAAGSTSDGQPFLLRYVSGHWRNAAAALDTAALTTPEMRLTTIRAATATAGWALGQRDQGATQVFYRYKVGALDRWEPTVSFDGAILNALSVVSDHEVWIVGSYGSKTLIIRITVSFTNTSSGRIPTVWDTHSWDVGSGNLYSVSMLSSTDGWAAGMDGQGEASLYHWDGRQWKQVPFLPNGAQSAGAIIGIVMTGADSGWLYGETTGANGSDGDSTFFVNAIVDGRLLAYPPLEGRSIAVGAVLTPGTLLTITQRAHMTIDPAPSLYQTSDGQPCVACGG